VTTINRTYPTQKFIGVNYKDEPFALIGSALLLSLFLVGLIGFLTRRQKLLPFNVLGFGVPRNDTAKPIKTVSPTGDKKVVLHIQNTLPTLPCYRELSRQELNILFNAADLKGKQIISLLLTGLTLDEVASLKSDQIDLEIPSITVFGGVLRTLVITSTLKMLFEQSDKYPVWDSIKPMSFAEMNRTLLCAARNSDLANSETINAESIRHSYIMYLIRLGIPSSQLRNIVGYLESSVLSTYNKHAPTSLKYSFNDSDLIYPLFLT
jgi:polysaccharide biosynthesis transport protein